MALAGYRKLLRSVRYAFHGDNFAIVSAQGQIRSQILDNRTVSDPARLQELLQSIDEVDEMLRFHVVQGRKNTRGNFEVKLTENNLEAVKAGQDQPHGPLLEPVDQSITGKGVTITKSTGSTKEKSSSCGHSHDHSHSHDHNHK